MADEKLDRTCLCCVDTLIAADFGILLFVPYRISKRSKVTVGVLDY